MSVQERADQGAATLDRAESVGAIVRQLATAQKSSVGAPAYSRWVNRPVGRVFAALAYRAGWTPNAVTALSAAFSALGIVLLAVVPARWWTGVAIAAALVVGYALDSADGQLARLRGGGSLDGEWLDHMVDATKIAALHLAVLISWYRFFDLGDARGLLLVPMGFTVISTVTFFGFILTDQLRRAGGAPAVKRPASVRRSLLAVPTDYGLLCVIFLVLGAHQLFVAVYTVLFVGNLLFCSKWVKWFRDMRAL